MANYDRMIMITIAWPVNREAWICVPSHLVSEKIIFKLLNVLIEIGRSLPQAVKIKDDKIN